MGWSVRFVLGAVVPTRTIPCGKCGGSGFLPEYRAIAAGWCFACGGAGVVPFRKKNPIFVFSAIQDGERREIYRIVAPTEAAAFRRVNTMLANVARDAARGRLASPPTEGPAILVRVESR